MSNNVIKLPIGEVEAIGRFQLKINADPKKFNTTNILGFVPKGSGPSDFLGFMTEQGMVKEMFLHKVLTTLKPDDNEVDKHNVKVLIQHPDVNIQDIIGPDKYRELVRKKAKKSNPKFNLTNIDKVEDSDFEENTKIIQARAVLYSTNNPLSREKLIWLCSNFNIPYKNNYSSSKKERIHLVKQLDKFLQSSETPDGKNPVRLFINAVSDIARTEIKYYINELMEIGTITKFGGIYKIDIQPVGSTIDDIIDYYNKNQDLFFEHKRLVIDNNR